MPRINDAEIERLKRTVPIADLIESSGVRLERQGAQLVGRCPWHAGGRERTPSLIVTPAKNLFHCMGACKVGGTVVDFVMKRDGVTFLRAIQVLMAFQSRAAVAPEPKRAATKTTKRVDSSTELDHGPRTSEELLALDEATTQYTDTLKQTPAALSYLMDRRGLMHPNLIDHFRLGFSNRTLVHTLPGKTTPAGESKLRVLRELGVLGQNHYEHFTGALVFPILDEDGRVLGMYGRKATTRAAGRAVHLYLPGPHRGVFNVKALAGNAEIILCEAIIDALTFWCAGFTNVISSYGVTLTPDHVASLKKHKTERVLIAYDRDDAGDRGAEAVAEQLGGEGIHCYRVELPKGMDVNEYALQLKPASKSLDLVLRKAVPMLSAPPRSASTPAIAAPDLEPTTISSPPMIEAPELASSNPSSLLVAPSPAPAPTPASLMPVPTDVAVEQQGEDLILSIADRRYRIRDLTKNSSRGSLRINLLVVRGERYFVDSLDLYLSRPRAQYVRMAAESLGLDEKLVENDIGKVLRKLEQLQNERVRALMEPKDQVPAISPADEAAAMSFLRDPQIFERIVSDFERAGVVGEETNKVVAYLAAVSRKLDDPLAVIVQSSSAAGKSNLVDAVLAFMPEEECSRYSAMTGQSLYYMTKKNLKHKILAIAEEEGAERASYALKLLQSDHKLVSAAPTKDDSGAIETKDYTVEGPVAIFLTTTSIDVDEELLNRTLILTIDEDRAQTRAIHKLQRKRETLEGLVLRREKQAILRLHQNAQRLLQSVHIINPYAEKLTFVDHTARTRRDHNKYLALIRSVALLRQHQKSRKTVETSLGEVLEYIEVEESDIALADRLAREVLDQTVSEMPPQTTRLLESIVSLVMSRAAEEKIEPSEVRFSRREIRESTGVGNTRLKIHMKRLEDLEHIALRGGRGYRFEYQLLSVPSLGETPKWSPPDATWSQGRSNMVAPEVADGRGVSPPVASADNAHIDREMKIETPSRSPQHENAVKDAVPTNGALTNGVPTNGAHAGPVTPVKASH